jgi:hypothetical protein
MGVHAGAKMIADSYAVDFIGHSTGSSVMPGQVVAAANGVITSVCSDGTSMAIRVNGGPVPLAYFHFAPGQSFTEGQSITQGQVLGELRHGTFTGSNCGYAVQQSESYHLHFVFLPTSPGYLEIGGCILDLSTQAFVCNGTTYTKLSYIPNGGAASNPTNPSDPGSGTNPTGGGVHIWDGIVSAIVELNADTISQYLPQQNPTVGYAAQKVMLIVQALVSIWMVIMSFGWSAFFLPMILLTVVTLELSFKVVQIAADLFKAGGWLLKFFI